MKNIVQIALMGVVVALASSCQSKGKPNYQYMPNMYQEVSYEAYGNYDVFPNGMEAMVPAEGSVSRGWMPYEYEDNREGYEAAKANLKNPIPFTEDNVNKGKALFTTYCAVCHGDEGNGKGILAQREKILGIPAYNDEGRAITEGSVYHVTYYGINNMGSYATQTTEKELWQINHYVMILKDKLDGLPERPFEDASSSGSEAQMTANSSTG
ncbi:hypothetical protein LCGC14_2678010, partial [marine sediment metagenome]